MRSVFLIILSPYIFLPPRKKSKANAPTYVPRHDKTNKMACAPSEDSDKPGHPLMQCLCRLRDQTSLNSVSPSFSVDVRNSPFVKALISNIQQQNLMDCFPYWKQSLGRSWPIQTQNVIFSSSPYFSMAKVPTSVSLFLLVAFHHCLFSKF